MERRRRLRWLQPWLRRGYTVEQVRRGGHYKVLCPHGHYVCTVSCSPRNPMSPQFEAERILRRHFVTEEDR